MMIKEPAPQAIVYVFPTSKDIQCGRGARNFQHPGNQFLRALIASKLPAYCACSERREKTVVIEDTIEIICKQGGRFLKYDHHHMRWYDGGFSAAKMRVGVAFRDAIKLGQRKYQVESCTKDRIGDTSSQSPKRDAVEQGQAVVLYGPHQDRNNIASSPSSISASSPRSSSRALKTSSHKQSPALAACSSVQNENSSSPSSDEDDHDQYTTTTSDNAFEPHKISKHVDDREHGITAVAFTSDSLSSMNDIWVQSPTSSLSSSSGGVRRAGSDYHGVDSNRNVDAANITHLPNLEESGHQRINERKPNEEPPAHHVNEKSASSRSSSLAEAKGSLGLFTDKMLSEIGSLDDDDYSFFTSESVYSSLNIV